MIKFYNIKMINTEEWKTLKLPRNTIWYASQKSSAKLTSYTL